jgi:hypothetical protein
MVGISMRIEAKKLARRGEAVYFENRAVVMAA